MVEHARNLDELIEKMISDDLRDQMELLGKCSPRDYARAHGITPQLVYYYIRAGKIEMERCICGRSVIDTERTDEFFRNKASGKTIITIPEAEEAPRKHVDAPKRRSTDK